MIAYLAGLVSGLLLAGLVALARVVVKDRRDQRDGDVMELFTRFQSALGIAAIERFLREEADQ